MRLDAPAVGRSHSPTLPEQKGIGLLEWTQRKPMKALDAEPAGDRPLAAGERQPDPGRQCGHQDLPKPTVHQPEHFVLVQDDNYRRRQLAEVPPKANQVVEAAGRVEETALGRLDRAAIKGHDAGPRAAGLAGKPVDKAD